MTCYSNPFSCRGVSFLNASGQFREEYDESEKLQLLGLSSQELDEFIDLFCPGTPRFVMTRTTRDDWTTPPGRLTRDHVLTHLLGNVLPNILPQWVGPRSCGWTRMAGIDVDFHEGEDCDFRRRCKLVRRALKILGVPNEGILVSATPSGGRHYRFFFTRPVKTDAIAPLLAKVGVVQRRGKLEILPSTTCGFRLPFGLITGREHQLTQASEFLRRYRSGQVPQIDWIVAIRRAESHERRHPPQTVTCGRLVSNADMNQTAEPAGIGPVRSKPSCVKRPFKSDQASSNISGRREAVERLWAQGIQETGTRTEATLALAWHLRFVRGVAAGEAAELLVEWVYRTGRCTSATVMKDRRHGTRTAEQQTLVIIRWVWELSCPRNPSHVIRHRISSVEVEAILKHLEYAAKPDQLELLEFSLEFLNFCKLHGVSGEAGWAAEIAAAEVMRGWRRCSGSWYKRKRDMLEAIGLIKTLRGEWKPKRGTGRARTYQIALSPVLSAGAEMTVAEAMAYGKQRIEDAVADGDSTSCDQRENDSIEEIVKNNLTTAGIWGEQANSIPLFRSQRPGLSTKPATVRKIVPSISPVAIARQEYASTRRKLLSLYRPVRTRAVRLQVSPGRSAVAADNPCHDLPLPADCREWLLRNAQPGMGIPKRYRQMIEAAQRSTTIRGPSIACLATQRPDRSGGSPDHLAPPDGALRYARPRTFDDHGSG